MTGALILIAGPLVGATMLVAAHYVGALLAIRREETDDGSEWVSADVAARSALNPHRFPLNAQDRARGENEKHHGGTQ